MKSFLRRPLFRLAWTALRNFDGARDDNSTSLIDPPYVHQNLIPKKPKNSEQFQLRCELISPSFSFHDVNPPRPKPKSIGARRKGGKNKFV